MRVCPDPALHFSQYINHRPSASKILCINVLTICACCIFQQAYIVKWQIVNGLGADAQRFKKEKKSKEKEKCGETVVSVTSGCCRFCLSVFLCVKNMRRNVLIAGVMLMAMSCGLREIGGEFPQKNEGIWKGPGACLKPGDSGSVMRSVWYVTGFDYPDGYDWMSDPDAGTVKCSLVVYANAVPMLKVPVGKEYQTSADPDMHRMIRGDLYTDYSTDSLTVIKKNGKHLFSYPGREMIVSMHVDSTGIYTLGQSRSGSGLTFRRDGELLYNHARGHVLGQLSPSGNAFAFAEKVHGIGKEIERYYLYDNGEVLQVGVRDDVTRIWDVVQYKGKVHYLASLIGINYPVHVSDDGMQVLDFPAGSTFRSCAFLRACEDLVIEGVYDTVAGKMSSRLWRNGVLELTSPAGMTLCTPYVAEGGVSGILVPQASGGQKIYRSGELYDIPDGYTAMGTSPLAMVDGILHVGLTAIDGGGPVVWQDGEIKKLGFNGYIASVSVWNP